jgi:hypothetical protein
MAKTRPMSPEEAEYEATREERDRWMFAQANRNWARIKAREAFHASPDPTRRFRVFGYEVAIRRVRS